MAEYHEGEFDDLSGIFDQPAQPLPTVKTRLVVGHSGKRFSKWVVRYCIIAVSLFTITVLVYNWTGRMVQGELIGGFITAFAVHLVTVAWVTAVKEKQNDD